MDGFLESMSDVWSDWSNLVADNLMIAAIVAAVLVAALIGLGLWLRARRSSDDEDVVILPEADERLVRRPVYLDPVVLADVLAHLEKTDHGRSIRTLLEDEDDTHLTDERPSGEIPPTERVEQVRALNKALAVARSRRDRVTVLGEQVDELPMSGSIVVVRGELEILEASVLARVLNDAAPLLAGSTLPIGTAVNRGEHDEQSTGSLRVRTQASTTQHAAAPIVVAINPIGSSERVIMVLDADGLGRDIEEGATVSALAIVDRRVGRNEKLGPADYLPRHLPPGVRSALADRDMMDVALPLTQAVGSPMKRKHVVERGPAGLVTPAALW